MKNINRIFPNKKITSKEILNVNFAFAINKVSL